MYGKGVRKGRSCVVPVGLSNDPARPFTAAALNPTQPPTEL